MSGSPAPDPDGFDSLLALVNDASARRTRDEPAAPYDQEADGRTGDTPQSTGDDRTAAPARRPGNRPTRRGRRSTAPSRPAP